MVPLNGPYLTGTPLARLLWLSTGRVKEWMALGGPGVEAMRTVRLDSLTSA